MGLEQEPFRKYNLDEDKKKADVFSVKLNKKERALLNECKRKIEQPKDSTALKTLAWVGSKVILDELTGGVIDTIFKNKKNNWRSGISEIE